MSDLSGDTFKAADVAEFYRHRPPYAAGMYQCLIENASAAESLLDLGCGTGKIARPMAKVFKRVVAVDPSASMIEMGRSLENGRATNIEWIEAKAEAAPLSGLFDVVTFASSIHWMAPEPLFQMLRQHVTANHLIAIISGDEPFEPPWQADWQQFLEKWVPEVSGRPLGSDEWQAARDRHLPFVDVIRSLSFLSDPFQQSVESFILCQHSRNTFALQNLKARTGDFRGELRALLMPYADANGLLTYQVKSHLTLARLKPMPT